MIITDIEITRIHPHPNNPRKDLGDLTELAESIKVRGVQQNLTVIEQPRLTEWAPTFYIVVIGHRRLKAAEMAGLTEVPCVISDMDEKTQIATMLLENMQRSDLTMIEEAEGLQMMLDLGESVKNISSQTGISETTVRRRVKLLGTFGRVALEAVQGRPIKIEDYEKLYQITDDKERNQALGKIGTHDFDWTVNGVLRKQDEKECKKKIIEALKGVAKKGTVEEARKGTIIWSTHCTDDWTLKALKKETKKLNANTEHYYYQSDGYGGIGLYTKEKQIKEKPEVPQHEQERKARIKALEEAHSLAYSLRLAFAKGFSANTGKLVDAVDKMGVEALFFCSFINKDTFRDLVGFEGEFRREWENPEEGETFEAVARGFIDRFANRINADAIFAGAYCRMDDARLSTYSNYYGRYEPEDKLQRLYDHLTALGYEKSTDEIKLLDGTHELYSVPATTTGTDADDEEPKCR